MKHTRHYIANVLAEKTLHVKDSKKLAREIAAYLMSEQEKVNIDSLVRDIMQYRADHGVIEAVTVSAHGVDTHTLTEVKLLLKQEFPDAKTVIVTQEQDPSVVGGLRIDLANEQLDLSIKSKLSTFKRLIASGKE
jgi:F0F1-type ATP synthase delta subunit